AGKISRRRPIETLTLAATTAYAADSAGAQENPLKAQLINHLSYTCPDFKKAADWYSMVLNADQVGPTKRDVVVVLGKKGEQPYGVTAKDVRSEEHTSELQSPCNLVCRLLLEKKKKIE